MDLTANTSDEQSELTRISGALAPDFKILGELGRGGMGVVYLAVDVNLDREVAIKVLPSHLARELGVRERFLREARTAARLTHPHIVAVYRADEMGGIPFFVMRHIDGESLADRLARSGTMSPVEVARIMAQVADSLDYAHSRGVIHRDIKPENILLERGTGAAIVTDFGIARVIEGAPQTATGTILGTVNYMSPEQVVAERVDGRSDVYSLGVVGFKALTGSLPFENKMATAVLVDRVTKEPPKVSSVAPQTPQVIADIVDRCLARDVDARFQSAGALATAVNEAARAIQGSTPSPGYSATRSDLMPTVDSAPQIVSEREANAIWSRAAQLQAQTGVQAARQNLKALLGPPTASDRRSLTSGYRISDVRAAADEVGIPAKYVERAQRELGLAAEPEGVTAAEPSWRKAMTVRSDRPRMNYWVGAPTSIVYEVEVPREVRPDQFEILVFTIQRALGDPGHVSTLGRSLNFALVHQQRRLQISIVPRQGQTTIRVEERLGPVIGGIFGGVVGGGGGGVGGGLSLPIGVGLTHSALVGFSAFGATAFAAYLAAREIFRTVRSRRERQLIALVEDLSAQIIGDHTRA